MAGKELLTQDRKNHVAERLSLLAGNQSDGFHRHATLTINQAINYAKGQALKYLSVEATVIDSETGEDIVSGIPSDFSCSKQGRLGFCRL